MISMNNVGSAGQALRYLSADNCYTQDEGLKHPEWFGKGVEHLGLSSEVGRQAFPEVLNEKVDGQELDKRVKNEEIGKKEHEHRPSTGITFSAPKSVSLTAEVHGKRDVREAHEAVVKKTLNHTETRLARTWQAVDGKAEAIQVDSVAVAMFWHNTSHDFDPQTHMHAVIVNATRREDGRWRSLTNEEIYNAQRVIGATYTSELTSRFQALNYDIRRTDEKNNFETAGITREQIEHFGQRRVEIETALKAKGVDIGDTNTRQKKDATLKTRTRKVDVDHRALVGSWKERVKDIGIDLDATQAKADVQRTQSGVVRADKLAGREAISSAVTHLIECEAVAFKNDLIAVATEYGAGRVLASEVERAFDKLEKDGGLMVSSNSNYTTKKILSSEIWALDQVRVQKGQTPKMMEPEAVAARITQTEGRRDFRYNGGQKEAISKVPTTENRYMMVQGLIRTGKTIMLEGVREMVQEQSYTMYGMAPTGATSKVLARETGIAADTISTFQIKERQLRKDIEFAKQYVPNFQRGTEAWIMDGSSFLSQHQKAQLDHMAEKTGTKVVYPGDTLQLQGVEAGKLSELARRDSTGTAYITEINHQKIADLKQTVGIITDRDNLGDGQRLTRVELANNARTFEYMDKAGMVRETPEEPEDDKGRLAAAVAQDILRLDKAERGRTITITAYNEGRRTINAGVHEGLKEQGELSRSEGTREIYTSRGWARTIQKEAQYYKASDMAHFGRGYQQIDAKKGEYMHVSAVGAPNGTVVLQKENGSVIAWQLEKHNKIEVYDRDTRELTKGDPIRITRSEDEFENDEVARVMAVAEDRVTLGPKQGKDMSLYQMGLSRNKHWDHAYTQTVHVSQGATQHWAIFHIRAPQTENEREQERTLKNMAKVFGDRSLYVGATYASHELCIYTNDKTVAAKAMAVKQDKTSAVEALQQYKRATTITADKAGERPVSPQRNSDVQRQFL